MSEVAAAIYKLDELLRQAEADANYAVDTLNQILAYCNQRRGRDLDAEYVRNIILSRHPVEDEDDD